VALRKYRSASGRFLLFSAAQASSYSFCAFRGICKLVTVAMLGIPGKGWIEHIFFSAAPDGVSPLSTTTRSSRVVGTITGVFLYVIRGLVCARSAAGNRSTIKAQSNTCFELSNANNRNACLRRGISILPLRAALDDSAPTAQLKQVGTLAVQA
jgi:hypothetical protein